MKAAIVWIVAYALAGGAAAAWPRPSGAAADGPRGLAARWIGWPAECLRLARSRSGGSAARWLVPPLVFVAAGVIGTLAFVIPQTSAIVDELLSNLD